MDSKSICEMTALQMRAEIEIGHLSARQVVEAHLINIEARNSAINAIVTLDAEGALLLNHQGRVETITAGEVFFR